MDCFGDCYDLLGPPPNMILSMPPPPLPTFLLPRSSTIITLSGNNSQPCFTAFMCDTQIGNTNRDKNGIEYIELTRKGQIGSEDTWMFILISSCVGVLLFGILLAMILIKCRDSYNYSYQETSIKQAPQISTMQHLGTNTNTSNKSSSSVHKFMSGTVLYPTLCVGPQKNNLLQQQLVNEQNRVLWATLTPNGTKHFLTEPIKEDHYEIMDIDYYDNRKCMNNKINNNSVPSTSTPVKSSFENTGYVDYDYEDPIQLADTYNNHIDDMDMDSGYQEPHEIIGTTLTRNNSSRPIVQISSPLKIDNPNIIAPLNQYPHRNYQLQQHQQQQQQHNHHQHQQMINGGNSVVGTLINNKKLTLNRGLCEINYYGTNTQQYQMQHNHNQQQLQHTHNHQQQHN